VIDYHGRRVPIIPEKPQITQINADV
jgi:hypothetical protein